MCVYKCIYSCKYINYIVANIIVPSQKLTDLKIFKFKIVTKFKIFKFPERVYGAAFNF